MARSQVKRVMQESALEHSTRSGHAIKSMANSLECTEQDVTPLL
jgi:hypothetical protein